MAAGEGGFSNQINGFNKAEVNEYISKMSKEKQKLEQDLKTSEDKLKAAVKIASEADNKISAAKEENDKKIADLNAQIKTERKKSEELVLQIDDLKRKLKNGGKVSVGDPNAEKRAEEIINSANAKARRIIADAEMKAAEISKAPGKGGAAVDTGAFMALFKGFQTALSDEIRKFGTKASEILKTPAPSFAAAPAPADTSMSMEEAFFENMDNDAPADDMNGFENMTAPESPEIKNVMDTLAAAANDMDMGSTADDMNVAPLEPEKNQTESMEDFGKELLEQTVPSSSLNDAMQDMFGGSSGELEINSGNDSVDFDMGSGNGGESQNDIDAMNALLGQMSAGLESMDSSGSTDQPAEEPASSGDDNPWANLQAQLDAMEKSGDFGSDNAESAPKPEATDEAPKAPSADDSSIWNFGNSGSNGSDDMSDDMSADLFGSF